MSFESALHEHMVRRIVQEVKQRHGQLYSLTVYADLSEYKRNKPPRIGSFIPDVFARDVPETCRIIGEAKTPADFETPRSRLQIAAFLAQLATFENSVFYLAVPWVYATRASAVLSDLAAAKNAGSVTLHILDGL